MMRRSRKCLAAPALVGLASALLPGTLVSAGAQQDGTGVDLGGTPESVSLAPLDGVPLVLVEEALDGSVGLAFSEDVIEVTLAADVLFAFDSATLEPTAEPSIAEARELLTRATKTVTIVGHTDDLGSDEYNDELSLRRAESVRQALSAELSAAGVEVVVEGRGKRDPVAPNANEDGLDNPAGRQQNRRVTVSIPVVADS